jgi:SAM-dependent methyltransferase
VPGPFPDHFSGVASAYRAFRPGYPAALFEWLASVAPGRGRAVDLGCGTGQASVALAAWFDEVVALDPSAEQVARAEPHPRVRYLVAPAEATGLPGACADLVTAAQALHWFDQARLHAELRRIARPGAVFAAFTYGLCRLGPALDELVGRLYRDVLGPHWPPERAHVDAAYRTLPFPFQELEPPALSIEERWTVDRFIGYLGTWSAVNAFRATTGSDPLAPFEGPLRAAWGAEGSERTVAWDLAVRAGRIAAAG